MLDIVPLRAQNAPVLGEAERLVEDISTSPADQNVVREVGRCHRIDGVYCSTKQSAFPAGCPPTLFKNPFDKIAVLDSVSCEVHHI